MRGGGQEGSTARTASAFKMPPKSEFPRFRATKLLEDPEHFLRLLERALVLHSVPRNMFERVLIQACDDELISRWVEETVIPSAYAWEETRSEFITKWENPTLRDKLKKQLDARTQKKNESVSDYAEDYRRLLHRLHISETDAYVITQMQRGFIDPIRQQMRQQRQTQRYTMEQLQATLSSAGLSLAASLPTDLNNQDSYSSVAALVAAAVQAEKAVMTDGSGREHIPDRQQFSRSRVAQVQSSKPARQSRSRKAAVRQAQAAPESPDLAGDLQQVKATLKRLELSAEGRPVNNHPRRKSSGRAQSQKTSNPKKSDTRKGHSCFICGSEDHMQDTCKMNKRECKFCKGQGHLLNECSKWDPNRRKNPRARQVHVAQPLTHEQVDGRKQRIMVTSKAMPGHVCRSVFVDTGAGFSCINRSLVEQYDIPMYKPRGPQSLDMADARSRVKRMGYVKINVTVHYLLNKRITALTCDKIFEVANLHEDFLLGTEMVPDMFPGSDIYHGTVDMDSITARPQNIRRQSESIVPRINRVRQAPWPTVASDSVEAAIMDERVLYDPDEADETDDDGGDPGPSTSAAKVRSVSVGPSQ